MAWNYNKLLGKITEEFGTQYNFAIAMGMSERTISLKLNSQVEWKQSDIEKAVKLLKIKQEDIPKYFFEPKVQLN